MSNSSRPIPQPSAVIQRADFSGREHLVESSLLDVQDLALQRQDGLGAAIAPLLGGSTGRVTLDDKDL